MRNVDLTLEAMNWNLSKNCSKNIKNYQLVDILLHLISWAHISEPIEKILL